MRHIEINETVYRQLLKRVESFEDTPNSVLMRMLGIEASADQQVAAESTSSETNSESAYRADATVTDVSTSDTSMRTRARSHDILPMDDYKQPILQAMMEFEGEASSHRVLERVGKILADQLTEKDRERLVSGEIRWRYRAQMARHHLVRGGYFNKDAGRGTWKLTDKAMRDVSPDEIEEGD